MKWVVAFILIAGIGGAGCGLFGSSKPKKNKAKTSAKKSSRDTDSAELEEEVSAGSYREDEDRSGSSKSARTSKSAKMDEPDGLSRKEVRAKCEKLFATYRKRRVNRLNQFYKVLDTTTPAVETVLEKENRDRDILHTKISEYEGRAGSEPGRNDKIWQQDYMKRVSKFETAMSTQLESYVKRRNKPAAKKVAKVKVSQKDLLYPKPVRKPRKPTTRKTSSRRKTSSSCRTVKG